MKQFKTNPFPCRGLRFGFYFLLSLSCFAGNVSALNETPVKSNIILTKNQNDQSYAFFDSQKLNLNFDFTLSFTVNLGDNNDGGQGLAFVLHNDPRGTFAQGDGGACLGVYQCSADGSYIQNALALEFDTNYSTSNQSIGVSDLSTHDTDSMGHIAITLPQPKTSAHYNLIQSQSKLNDGKSRQVSVYWNASTQQLSYTITGYPTQTHTLSDLNTVFKSHLVYWGFTSASSHNQAIHITHNPNQHPSANASIKGLQSSQWKQSLSLHQNDAILVKLQLRMLQDSTNPSITWDAPTYLQFDGVHDSSEIVAISKGSNQIQTQNLQRDRVYNLVLQFKVRGAPSDGSMVFNINNHPSNVLTLNTQPKGTLNYHANGGQNPPTSISNIKLGSKVSILPEGNMTNNTLTFTHWNTKADGSGEMYFPGQVLQLTHDLTLYAQWTDQCATLIIDANHTQLPNTHYRFKLNKIQAFPLESIPLTMTGYQLVGFNTNPDGSGTHYHLNNQVILDSDLTLYAQWQQKSTVTLTFVVPKTNREPTKLKVYEGEKLEETPKVSTPAGYQINGWMVDGTLLDIANTYFTRDTTLIASISPIGYALIMGTPIYNTGDPKMLQLSFDVGEYGTLDIQTLMIPVNSTLTFSPEPSTQDGYLFVGWELDGALINLSSRSFSQSTNLVARYVKASESNNTQNNTDDTAQQFIDGYILIAAFIFIMIALRADIFKSKRGKDHES